MKNRFIIASIASFFAFQIGFAAQSSPPEISQTIWGVVKLTGDTPGESHIRKISFSPAQDFKLLVDCNYYKGRYQAENGVMRINTLVKFAGDCEAQSKNDAMFLHALLGVERYELNNGVLKLATAKGDLIANLEPASTFEMPVKPVKAKSINHSKSRNQSKPSNKAQLANKTRVAKKPQSAETIKPDQASKSVKKPGKRKGSKVGNKVKKKAVGQQSAAKSAIKGKPAATKVKSKLKPKAAPKKVRAKKPT